MKEARLYELLSRHQARCQVCPRRSILPKGKSGSCETRANRGGKVFSRLCGKAGPLVLSPIEMKPMFPLYPGGLWLSLGSSGCNFRCPGCQKWEVAHGVAQAGDGSTRFGEEVWTSGIRAKA